jgi:Fe-S-cluster containining protein
VSRTPRRQSSFGVAAEQSQAALRAVYADVDRLLEGWSCDSSTDCCRFGVTGREPYPTAIEQAELERAVRARGGLPKRRSLPTVNARGKDERRCTLLSDEGKCLVYASRPFGCRTFFCERATGPAREHVRGMPKEEIARLARKVADLSVRFAPADAGPRPMSRVTAAWSERGDTRRRRG